MIHIFFHLSFVLSLYKAFQGASNQISKGNPVILLFNLNSKWGVNIWSQINVAFFFMVENGPWTETIKMAYKTLSKKAENKKIFKLISWLE